MELFKNVKQEWDKTTWPTADEMKKYTAQVFIFMVVLSLFFAGIDAVVSLGVSAATNNSDPIVVEVDNDYDYDYDDSGDLTFEDIDLDDLDIDSGFGVDPVDEDDE